jgi:prepilin-type N-terminal cleavage/methylation domain-containing protein
MRKGFALLEILITFAIIGLLVFLFFKFNFLGSGQKTPTVQQGINALPNAQGVVDKANQAGIPGQNIIDNLAK